VPDEEGDLADALFELHVMEANDTIEGAEQRTGCVETVAHLREDDWNYWLLQFVQLCEGEVTDW
jgi:hypothetical protein